MSALRVPGVVGVGVSSRSCAISSKHTSATEAIKLSLSMFRFFLFLSLVLVAPIFAEDRPNFVIIFIDDMGYGDIGPFGSTDNRTPNLDRMAEEGMKLTSA